MFKKLILLILLGFAIGYAATIYHLDTGKVILLTQHHKVAISTGMSAILLLIGFIILHVMLRLISFIRMSPKKWRKNRSDKQMRRHASFIEKGLLHQIIGEYSDAEYQYKQAYLQDPKTNEFDLAFAIHSLILAGHAAQAQSDVTELSERTAQIKETKYYLQATIYHEKNQANSAISTIKQVKHYLKKPHLCRLLAQCLHDSEQYQELLQFTQQRPALPTDEKTAFITQAHLGMLKEAMATNQIIDALKIYQQMPARCKACTSIVTLYLNCLLLDNNLSSFLRTMETHQGSLFSNENTVPMLEILQPIDQKEALKQIESLLSKHITQVADKKTALFCRALVYTKKQQFEKAIHDYQTIINLNLSVHTNIKARLKMAYLEKKIK